MGELYTNLPRHVKDMAAEELRQYFPEGTEKSYLMRSIIMNEKRFTTVRYMRTLRSMWYSAVKPTLDKLGLLTNDDQTEEGLTKWDATLSRYVGDLLRRGALTYQDLWIADQSRQKQNPRSQYYTVSNETYGYKATIAPYSNIIIATEKDTVYNIISDIARLFGCSCISSKGQNSLGAMELLIRGMKGNYDTIFILTMTDYDPAGYYIADALEKQAWDIINALDLPIRWVNIRRIGITPDQLTEEEVEANKYTPKPANLDKWVEITGGINGEAKGLELDAFSPDQIREIFVENLVEFVDLEVYKDFVKDAYIRKTVLTALQPYIDDIMQQVAATVSDDMALKPLDMLHYAKLGLDSLPIGRLCYENNDDRIKVLAEAFINPNPDLDGNDPGPDELIDDE